MLRHMAIQLLRQHSSCQDTDGNAFQTSSPLIRSVKNLLDQKDIPHPRMATLTPAYRTAQDVQVLHTGVPIVTVFTHTSGPQLARTAHLSNSMKPRSLLNSPCCCMRNNTTAWNNSNHERQGPVNS